MVQAGSYSSLWHLPTQSPIGLAPEIKNHIGNDAAHLTKIKEIELGGKTILGISVLKSKSGGWFYLNETDFYVRLHNRTESLNGPDADKYKLENQ